MFVLLTVAFLSGLLTIFAPCIWPILPVILSTSATGGKHRPIGLTIGILISFSLLTLSLSYLVRSVGLNPQTLRYLAVIVLTVVGLSQIIPTFALKLETFTAYFTSKLGLNPASGTGFGGGLGSGLFLGILWSPCAGPILATIASLSATRSVTSQVVLLALVYSLGLGIPLFIFTLLGNRILSGSRALSPHLGRIQTVFGLVMITTALLLYSNYDKVIQAKLLSFFPSYTPLLYKLEQSNQVQEELRRLANKPQSVQTNSNSFLPDQGRAADFIGISNWINSTPLSLDKLNGKVVLVDFWTYSCVNCIRTLPYVKGWYQKYQDQGFVVVGVHTPEFEFEKSTDNVNKAIRMFDISYPVAQDNDYLTWNNYHNLYWPAKYLIDKNGHLRYFHFGEGQYKETEIAIQSLLMEAGASVDTTTLSLPSQSSASRLTSETYLGLRRLSRFESREIPHIGNQQFTSPLDLSDNGWAFAGNWFMSGEYAQASSNSQLYLNFYASKLFLVINPDTQNDDISVYLDGKLVSLDQSGEDVSNGKIKLDTDRLYNIIDLRGQYGRHELRLEFHTEGTKIFAFTFG